jgi:hypothetical protein
LSEPVETAPAIRRDRSPVARSAARRKKANREWRVLGFLNRGVSIAELAAREGVTERGMRKYVRSVLARRSPQLPAGFLALQVSRLNEALVVAYSAMSGSEPSCGGPRGDNRARARPLSRLRRRRRGRVAEAAPPRAAFSGPSGAQGARAGTEPNGAASP